MGFAPSGWKSVRTAACTTAVEAAAPWTSVLEPLLLLLWVGNLPRKTDLKLYFELGVNRLSVVRYFYRLLSHLTLEFRGGGNDGRLKLHRHGPGISGQGNTDEVKPYHDLARF